MRNLLAVLLAISLTGPAFAEASIEPEIPGQGLLARLGSPARYHAVEDLLSSTERGDADAQCRLAHALGHAGGHAALRGLTQILENPDDAVRAAVLASAARIDLRFETLAARVRRIATEESGDLRVAATNALGHLGDGRDMDLLLKLARSDDRATRDAAYRAMAHLTGANIPQVHARWTYYWKSFRRRAALLLPQTLVAVAMEAEAPDSSSPEDQAPDSAALLDLVRQYAWVDLPSVRDHIADWLHEPDVALRTVACRLAADLRLSDLGPALEMALRFASQSSLRQEVERALETLGVPVAAK